MIFPIGDDQVVGGPKPIFSYSFIILNVCIFLFQYIMTISQGQQWLVDFFMTYGHVPAYTQGGDRYYSLITSMFLHGGWMHLIGNMVFLWVFADNIESTIGNLNFLIYYLLGGIAASLVHGYFNPGSMVPGVGASGAIAAVLGTYLILYPRSRIKMIVVFFFITFYIPAILFLLFWIGQQLVYGIGSLNPEVTATSVAWWAHIGGFVYGIIVGLLLSLFIKPRELETVKRS